MASHSSAGSRATKFSIALRYRIFIFELADPFAPGERRIVDVDDKGFCALHQRQRLAITPENSGSTRMIFAPP